MEKRKRNGLEITCIGALYQGPWEKKYWSSSRGKDRYPYPVGYQAVRCYNGHSYHMEVQEGARGPMFVVVFGEGMKCSADTPTIAWQDALKKTSSLSKRTRLLSSDINGSELFGFLDPLVQRLFRELILVHEGEAQPDDISCPKNKADDGMQQESTTLSCPEGFGWNSSRTTVQVRKSRTSIVRSETKGSTLYGESSLKQLGCVKEHRKRLKLQKPPKRTREDSEAELSGPCDQFLSQFIPPKFSQPKEGCTEGNVKITPMPENSCESMKVPLKENSKEEVLKGAVIPDSYDEFPSQIFIAQEGIHEKLIPLLYTINENRNEHLALTSGDNICLPLVSLLDPEDSEGPLSFKHKIEIDSSQKFKSGSQDLILPPETALEVQLENAVVPDSCDIRSQDLSLPTKPDVHFKNVVVPDSYDMESGLLIVKEAGSCTQGDSQIVLEQTSADFGKSKNLPGVNVKDESQSSEGNTQKGESDSLGQELTKSMISLLLPQALQILSKKGRKKKKPITSIANEVEIADLSSVASELKVVDEKELCFSSNEVKQQVSVAQDPQSIQKEDVEDLFTKEDGICARTDENQLLHSAEVGLSNKPLNADLEFLNNHCQDGLQSSHKTEQSSDKVNDADRCKPKLSNNMNCCGEVLVDDSQIHWQQALNDCSHQCTVMLCDNLSPVNSFPVEFLMKKGVYNANDRPTESSLSISPQSPLAKVEQRSLAEVDCLQDSKTEGFCTLLSNSPNTKEKEDFFVEGMQSEVEKDMLPSEMSNSSKGFTSEHNLGFEGNATIESVSNPFTGQKLSAVSPAFVHEELLPKHSVDSTGVIGGLACQDTIFSNDQKRDFPFDLHVEQRSADASEYEARESVLQTDFFVPKACLENPMPVLAMKITVQGDQARLLICCKHQDATRLLFVYQLAGKELLPSLLSSATFHILDCKCNAACRGLIEFNGIQFTPGGQELLLLGMFKIRETTEEKQDSLDEIETCLCDIQLVSYSDGKLCVDSRLSSSGSKLYCVLPLDKCVVFAGGESGIVTGWIMDTPCRLCKESFTLPVPSIDGHLSSHIIQLSGVSTLPSIVVGCDDQGLIAIWNFVSRQLLRSSKLSVQLPLELHILNMHLVVHSDCAESGKVPPLLARAEGTQSVTEKVAASLLVSTLNHQGVGPQDSVGQSISKSWSLEILKRDYTCAIFSLNQLHERISTVDVSEKLGLAGTSNGCVIYWDTMSGSVMGTLSKLKDEPVSCIARDQACNIIAVAGATHALIYAKQT